MGYTGFGAYGGLGGTPGGFGPSGVFGGVSTGGGLSGAPGGGAPSGGNAGWGNIGGGFYPTAMGNIYGGNIPQWFTNPPAGMAILSPLAQAYLSQMFSPWVSNTGATAEYMPANPAMTTENITGGTYVPSMSIAERTAVQTPRTPSAQLYSQLSGQGVLPALQSYFNNILGAGAWEAFIAPLQALWPAATTERPVQWQTTKQR